MRGPITRLRAILYGADYSPEQWPPEVWAEDVALMREAGVNIVTIGMFTWVKLEPAPDRYEFGWLDRVLDLLHGAGIAVDLATPTASPPAWMVRADPSMLPRTVDGTVLWHGSRHHYCPHSATFRERARRVTHALAEHVRDHPALAMWHIDNEIGCHVGECFCDASVTAFRDWLRARHGTLERLDHAWGTAFWGQTYLAWDEVDAPRRMPAFRNPGQLLDWKRFWSESWMACFDDQAAILREVTPSVPLTTNFMGFFEPIDYWELARREDVVSNDRYPDTTDPDWMVESAAIADLMRSLGGGRPWMVMEQATANVNWMPRNPTKRPGVMRLGSLQAVARGADGVLFFQWRASPAGGELWHSAMVQHGGPVGRTWREVTALGAELAGLSELVGSRVVTDAGLVFDWESRWAIGGEGAPAQDLDLVALARDWYASALERRLTLDLVHPRGDLSRHRLLVAPALHLLDTRTARSIADWVGRGGTLVTTFLSGLVDPHGRVHPGPYPGPLRELLGLVVEEYTVQGQDPGWRVRTSDGLESRAGLWTDVLRLEGATAVAEHLDDLVAGTPAVTVHHVGAGTVWYVGTRLDAEGIGWVLDQAMAAAGIAPGPVVTPVGARVEVVRRTDGDHDWWFVLNHGHEPASVRLPGAGTDVGRGGSAGPEVTVGPVDARIVRMPAGLPGT
jgi:beta-galactosidase